MRICLKLAAIVFAVAATTATSQAAVLTFSGAATGGSTNAGQLPGFLADAESFDLSVTYNESASNTASVTGSTLKVKLSGGQERIFTGGTTGSVGLLSGNKDLKITVNYFNLTAAAGEPNFGNLDITFTKLTALGSSAVNAANVAQFFVPYTTYLGNLDNGTIFGTPNTTGSAHFAGSIPVPEPGSVGLLTGLGMVVGRRVWRRRPQKKSESAV